MSRSHAQQQPCISERSLRPLGNVERYGQSCAAPAGGAARVGADKTGADAERRQLALQRQLRRLHHRQPSEVEAQRRKVPHLIEARWRLPQPLRGPEADVSCCDFMLSGAIQVVRGTIWIGGHTWNARLRERSTEASMHRKATVGIYWPNESGGGWPPLRSRLPGRAAARYAGRPTQLCYSDGEPVDVQ